MLTGAVSRYPALLEIRPPPGINWHIFKTQQSKQEPKQTFAIGKMLAALCKKNAGWHLKRLGWRLGSWFGGWLCCGRSVRRCTWGVSSVGNCCCPGSIPLLIRVMQRWAGRTQRGGNLLWLLYAANVGRSLSKELPFAMRCRIERCDGEHVLELVHAVPTVALGAPVVEQRCARSHSRYARRFRTCSCLLFLKCRHEEGGCGYLQWDT